MAEHLCGKQSTWGASEWLIHNVLTMEIGRNSPSSPLREVSPCFWLYYCIWMLLGCVCVWGGRVLVGVFLLILNSWPSSLNTMIFLVGLIYSMAYTFKSTWMTLFLAFRSLSILHQTTHKQNIQIRHLSPHSSFLSRVFDG